MGEMAASHGFFAYEADPCSNAGAVLEFADFSMRAYCWCDGGAPGHARECPPNFDVPSFNFAARWYKCLGRESEVNRIPTRAEWKEIIALCNAQVEEQMADYEFTRQQVRPNVGIQLFNQNLDPVDKPSGSLPHAFTVEWSNKGYAAIRDEATAGYDIYLMTSRPPLRVWPALLQTATLRPESKLGHISTDELGISIYPDAEHPRAWGNWISTAVFSYPLFTQPATPAAVEYSEPTEDELDYLLFEESMRGL